MYIIIHNHYNHAILTDFGIFGISHTHSPSQIMAKFGMEEYTHGLGLHAKFHLEWFIASSLRGKERQILPHYQLQHSVVAQPSSVETKLNGMHNYKPSHI